MSAARRGANPLIKRLLDRQLSLSDIISGGDNPLVKLSAEQAQPPVSPVVPSTSYSQITLATLNDNIAKLLDVIKGQSNQDDLYDIKNAWRHKLRLTAIANPLAGQQIACASNVRLALLFLAVGFTAIISPDPNIVAHASAGFSVSSSSSPVVFYWKSHFTLCTYPWYIASGGIGSLVVIESLITDYYSE